MQYLLAISIGFLLTIFFVKGIGHQFHDLPYLKSELISDTLLKNQEEAVAFAEPILFKTYGKKNIRKQRPYKCDLDKGIWIIQGTLKKGYPGGVFDIRIDARDGQIIKVIHGK